MSMMSPERLDLLLKMNGLRKSCGLSWKCIVDVYEAESGEKTSENALRCRVRRAVERRRREMEAENTKVLEEFEKKCQKRGDLASRKCQKRDSGHEKPMKTSFLDKIMRILSIFGGKRGRNDEND